MEGISKESVKFLSKYHFIKVFYQNELTMSISLRFVDRIPLPHNLLETGGIIVKG